MPIQIKRAYAQMSQSDGKRILIDTMWPRGLSKEDAKIDCWFKNIAPSKELRQWFGHDPNKWEEFKTRYLQELKTNPEGVNLLIEEIQNGQVTLIYAAQDTEHNNAVVLRDYLKTMIRDT